MSQNDRHRPRLVPIEFETNEKFTSLPLNSRVTLVLISNGRASFELNGKAIILTSPCVMMISQYDKTKLTGSSQLAAKSFSFNPVFVNSNLTFERLAADDFWDLEDEHDRNMMNMFLFRDEYYDGTIDLAPKAYLRISEWISIIGTETHAQSDPYWTCRIRRYLLQSLYLLDDVYMNRKVPNTIKREKSAVDILLEYIHTNYSSDITLDFLCKLVRLNRTSLSRKFKERTGLPPMEYLLSYRLKVTCDTLIHTNLSLSEIAEASGFKYVTYFIKQFTAKMGLSPTEYRLKNVRPRLTENISI